MVDDKSLDSTSGNNTESEHPKQRRVKSKKKDVETNTEARNGNQQQQGELFFGLLLSLSLPSSPAIHNIPSVLLSFESIWLKKKETLDRLGFFFSIVLSGN